MSKDKNKDVLGRPAAIVEARPATAATSLPNKGEKVKKELSAVEKRKFITNRKCLRCDGQHRSRWPGICKACKRHVDQEDLEEYTVHI